MFTHSAKINKYEMSMNLFFESQYMYMPFVSLPLLTQNTDSHNKYTERIARMKIILLNFSKGDNCWLHRYGKFVFTMCSHWQNFFFFFFLKFFNFCVYYSCHKKYVANFNEYLLTTRLILRHESRKQKSKSYKSQRELSIYLR